MMRAFSLFIFAALGGLLFPVFAQAGTIAKPMANTGLVGYWNFEYGKGGTTAYDLSGNRKDGTLRDMEPDADWVTGKVGQALSLDGSTERISAPNVSAPGSFTLSLWVNPTAVSRAKATALLSSRSGTYGSAGTDVNYSLYFGTNNGLGVCWTNPTNTYHCPGTAANILSANVWKHIVVVVSGVNYAFYVNGALIISGTAAAAPQNSGTQTLLMGHENDTFTYLAFAGSMDEVRVYNRALSATDVERLYKMSAPKYNASSVGEVANGLVGHWTFDGNDMTPKVIDRSGQGNHARLVNFISTTTIIGRLGQALIFDGTTQYINGGSLSSLDNLTRKTVSAWIYLNSWGNKTTFTASRIVQKASIPSALGWQFFVSNDFSNHFSNLAFRQAFTGPYFAVWKTANNTLSLRRWTHVAVSYDANTPEIFPTFYIDGKKSSAAVVAAYSSGSMSNDASLSLFLGGDDIGGVAFDGVLDDVRVYSRILSDDEVERLYNLGAPSKMSATPTGNDNLKNGLVGHWTFDGNDTYWSSATAGTASDRSGNGNQGTLTNMNRTTSPVLGRLGQAFDFENDGEYVNIADRSSLDIPGSFAVSAWINLASYPAATDIYGVVSKGGNGETAALNHNYLLVIDNNAFNGSPGLGPVATILYEDSGGTNYDAYFDITTSNFPLNTWHHVVGVFDDANNILNMYVDGVRGVTDTSATAAPNQSNQAIRVADPQTATASFFDGKIDDVRIYNRALSAEEVKQLYNLGR